MLTRFIPPALPTLTFLLTYAFLYMSAMPLLVDPDVPWHIAAGHHLLTIGIPAVDPWSYTAGTQPWYNVSWFWDGLLSLAEQIGGPKAVFALAVAVASLVAASLAYHLQRRGGIGSDALIFTLLVASLSLLDFTAARPQLAGFLFIPWVHLLLHESRMRTNKNLWWLPALMVVWVNTHATFMVGFTLIGAYGLEALITRRWDWVKQLFIIGACCLLALLVNPYGIHIYSAVMRTLDSVATQYISEWLPFVFGNYLGISLWLLAFILISNLREPTVPLADKILSVAWLVIALLSVRNAAVFMLVSAPYLAINLQRAWEGLESVRTPHPDALEPLGRPGMPEKLLLAAAVVVAGSLLFSDALRGSVLADAENDPGPAISYVQLHYADKRLLNDYNYGGRIAYDTKGTLPIFVDGRAGTAYPEEVLSDYLKFLDLDEGWQEVIDKYKIDLILISNKQRFATAFENGQYRDRWKRVYQADVASVFVKQLIRHRPNRAAILGRSHAAGDPLRVAAQLRG